jgi:ATP-dependent helicase Lhr and Lhr-like helicase
MSDGSFFRLHPHLRHAIAHDLGWRSLRPVQEASIDAILDGHNAVVLAPTAGGKTEASIFPVLSRILTEQIQPVAALYICPIRALLNNQEPRLEQYTRMVGLEVFKWHGDVSDSRKQGFRREPKHILMITPESLEVMLISKRTDARALFANLSVVIIDEVHAFAADDRGAHLVSILERLSRFCGRDIQRIGLSATVGNPREIGNWLRGSSERRFSLIDPPKPPAQRELRVEFYDDIGLAAPAIASLARGKKSLVFVESRAGAENVVRALKGRDVEVFIHHSSVSRADRALAEAQFAIGQNTAIVATSTMELGIDVGDLDQVIQVDAPSSVASFLQRIGRTGRRAGTRSNCTFFCTSAESLLQAVALITLAEKSWVEDVEPADQAVHVLAHQVMALTLQEGGLSRHRILPWLAAAFPFAGLDEERLQALITHMIERDILHESDGLLSLGLRGEKLYGKKNFFELYAVFSSPPVLLVMHGRTEVGHIQARFVQSNESEDAPLVFRLAGRAWRVERIEWSRGRMYVKPAEGGRLPSWLGQPHMLSFPLCQEMMRVLVEDHVEKRWLSDGACTELGFLREGYEGLLREGTAPLEYVDTGVQWHTFAGGAVNRLLAAGLEQLTGKKWTAGNLSLKTKDVGLAETNEAVDFLMTIDWDGAAASVAETMARGSVSKFQACLPPQEEARLLVTKLLDLDRTMRFLSTVEVSGHTLLHSRRRLEEGRVDRPVLSPEQLRLMLGSVCPRNPIEVIATTAELKRVAGSLSSEPVLGLDCETTMAQHSLCLLQLASPTRNYVIDVLELQDLEPLREILEGERVTKLVHYAHFERRVLGKRGFQLANVVDTYELSREAEPAARGGHSLAAVCERVLGISIDKSEQAGDWTRRPLTDEQVAYAALDAEVLLDLVAKLESEASTTA